MCRARCARRTPSRCQSNDWQPTKLAMIFGRKVTKRHRGNLETVIEHLDLQNPVIRSYCRDGSIKQYVRDHRDLCTRGHAQQRAGLGNCVNSPNRHICRTANAFPGSSSIIRDCSRSGMPSSASRSLRAAIRSLPGISIRPLRLPSTRPPPVSTRLPALRSVETSSQALVDRVEHSRRYRLRLQGYRICLVS